ncbi:MULTISPECIES: cold shock domain-containing protein [unclassified Candidatus Lariskella]|uniref:cold shock domain-containing protein n=1 Tax=unclassified Candidatus Lariskella TaxID=2632605 RepID=UPI0021F04EFE
MKYTGIVKWFNHTKGYGFIASDSEDCNEGKDVFIHKTALERARIDSLKEGDRITFEIKKFNGKVSAENVSLA